MEGGYITTEVKTLKSFKKGGGGVFQMMHKFPWYCT